MSDIESGKPKPEVGSRIILVRPDNQALELRGTNPPGVELLGGIRTALIAAMDGGLIEAAPFSIGSSAATVQSVSEQPAKAPPVASELTLADLRTPDHFRGYFTHNLGAFLGHEVELPLPSQEYVDRGNRIKDAGFTTYEPVAFPNLTIEQGFVYPESWKSPLDSWVYEQIEKRNLNPNVLDLRQLWGWLDTSVRLDWGSNGPMFDPGTDKPLADLLSNLRAKGERDGIAFPGYVEHLDPRSPFGVSADEIRTVVYPALAKMFGVKRGEIRDLTAVEFNFVGNLSYPHFGKANSWEWLNDSFEDGNQFIGGGRDYGGLSRVGRYPSGFHSDYFRFRPLVVS